MSIQILFACLLITDLILCLAFIILVITFNREIKKRPGRLDENTFAEFRKLMDESQSSTNHLLEVMNESRKALKEIAYVLNEREEKLRALVEESKIEYEKLKSIVGNPHADTLDKRYEEVISMVRQGLSTKEISQKLELTVGEVDLIIDLDRTRHRA